MAEFSPKHEHSRVSREQKSRSSTRFIVKVAGKREGGDQHWVLRHEGAVLLGLGHLLAPSACGDQQLLARLEQENLMTTEELLDCRLCCWPGTGRGEEEVAIPGTTHLLQCWGSTSNPCKGDFGMTVSDTSELSRFALTQRTSQPNSFPEFMGLGRDGGAPPSNCCSSAQGNTAQLPGQRVQSPGVLIRNSASISCLANTSSSGRSSGGKGCGWLHGKATGFQRPTEPRRDSHELAGTLAVSKNAQATDLCQ
ncbi:hypothetical protein H920_09262 [Fukomys damarensis]|uniref:Uncharacterized protein n=1 Tax=Fukomys damarensis TaxID=885580 RepID=A0A091DGC6_FUKDA|nr:hypothetical protein H920_09262 [Fukomys damarensis]